MGGGKGGVAERNLSDAVGACLQGMIRAGECMLSFREEGGCGGVRGGEGGGRAREWYDAFSLLLKDAGRSTVDAVRAGMLSAERDALSGWVRLEDEGRRIHTELQTSMAVIDSYRQEEEAANISKQAALQHWLDQKGPRAGDAAGLALAKVYLSVCDLRIPGEPGERGLGEGVWALGRFAHRALCCQAELRRGGTQEEKKALGVLRGAEEFLGRVEDALGMLQHRLDGDTCKMLAGAAGGVYVGGFKQLSAGVRIHSFVTGAG